MKPPMTIERYHKRLQALAGRCWKETRRLESGCTTESDFLWEFGEAAMQATAEYFGVEWKLGVKPEQEKKGVP